MSRDRFGNGDLESRPVLGDVTNRCGKRGFSFISGDLGTRSGEGYVKSADKEKENSNFTKQVCSRVENLVNENCGQSLFEAKKTLNLLEGNGDIMNDDRLNSFVPSVSVAVSSGLGKELCPIVKHQVDEGRVTPDVRRNNPSCEGLVTQNLVKENCEQSLSSNEKGLPMLKGKEAVAYVISNVPDEAMVKCDLLEVGGDLVSSDTTTHGITVNEACHIRKSQVDEGGVTLDVTQNNPLCESLASRICRTEGQQVEGCANSGSRTNLLKDCSCSFCLKVGYIWSDLHFQDIKGRISALKKSQKAASILVQKNSKGKETDICSQGHSSKSSKLEPDLSSQWKSLFSHMDNILTEEGNQLQASFVKLRNLRESCKTDLEMINRMPFDKH